MMRMCVSMCCRKQLFASLACVLIVAFKVQCASTDTGVLPMCCAALLQLQHTNVLRSIAAAAAAVYVAVHASTSIRGTR
jgi:hypothetical protein